MRSEYDFGKIKFARDAPTFEKAVDLYEKGKWFSYQNSLSEGCNRLSKIVSELPVSEQTAKLLVDMLLRLDDKLCRSGVDDSDGTVGGFIQALKEYAKLDPTSAKAFQELKDKETCFGREEPLLPAHRSLGAGGEPTKT